MGWTKRYTAHERIQNFLQQLCPRREFCNRPVLLAPRFGWISLGFSKVLVTAATCARTTLPLQRRLLFRRCQLHVPPPLSPRVLRAGVLPLLPPPLPPALPGQMMRPPGPPPRRLLRPCAGADCVLLSQGYLGMGISNICLHVRVFRLVRRVTHTPPPQSFSLGPDYNG